MSTKHSDDEQLFRAQLVSNRLSSFPACHTQRKLVVRAVDRPALKPRSRTVCHQ